MFMIGEAEYDTATTVPEFARAELEARGFRCTFAIAPSDESDEFPGLNQLKTADLLFISVRRHSPAPVQMELIRTHVASGKPVVGIRTASHAFSKRPGEKQGSWETFDGDALGGNYRGHYGKGARALAAIFPAAADHPVLTGIAPEEFHVPSHLYKNPDLPAHVTKLMTARLEGRPEVEPIAWVNTRNGRRVFYTSLGAREDFELPQFRRLLLNGIHWAVGLPVPAGEPLRASPAKTTNATVEESTAATVSPKASSALSPMESAQLFDVAADLEFEQVLAEPLVEQPVFLTFDERGRMWVVEYRQYPAPAGLKMLTHDSFWRAVYDKVPRPPPNHDPGRDRISIHEDSDGDGAFDKHSIFIDGLNICTAVERGRGGVWILNPPYLLFYADTNGDDRPDGDPIVHLAGFGLEDTHSVANSLRWGPDGWLYGAQGSTVTSAITRPGIDREPTARMIGQGIWRYHPVSRRFEVFAEGGGNTFGLEIDAKGRIFSGHNGGDTRGFHYLQGAYLRKGFDKHGQLSNPYAFGYFDAMRHGKVERFTHSFIIYEDRHLPSKHHGRLWGVEPLQGRLVESQITPDGSSFDTSDLDHPVISRDSWFRPVDIKVGPDGAIYVCDWYEGQIAHWSNHRDEAASAEGRIYRLKSRGVKSGMPMDMTRLDSEQLLAALHHPSRSVRQLALRVIGNRPDETLQERLRTALSSSLSQSALELLWAINLRGELDETLALECLEHRDAFVRLWTVRLLCDANEVSPRIAEKILQLALVESVLEVRAQVACSARRLPAKDALPIVRALLRRDEDAQDPRMPLLLWWAIEAKAESDRNVVVDLFRDAALWDRPLVKEHVLERISRRYALAATRRDLLTCARLFELAPTAEHTRKLMTGFEIAGKGRALATLPEELVKAMARHGIGSTALSLRQKAPNAVEAALKAVGDESAAANVRLEYIAIFGEVNLPESVPVLLKLCEKGDDVFRKAALNALAQYEDATIGEQVVALYPKMGKESQLAALNLLTTRPAWAAQFVRAVEAGRIAPMSVPAEIVLKIRSFPVEDVATATERIWGKSKSAKAPEIGQKLERWTKIVRSVGGDPYKGKPTFDSACSACHTLHGTGGSVGPDLTTFKRDDVETLLLSIVNPGAEIREGYESVFINTRDGRLLNGFLAEEDPQVVVVRALDGQTVTLPRNEVREIQRGDVSLMPEGLLDSLTDEQVRDLFAYLQMNQPLVARPLGR